MFIKDSSSWKCVDNIFVKESGNWRPVTTAWVKVNGVWKQMYKSVCFANNIAELATTLVTLTNGAQYGLSVAIGNGRIVAGAPTHNYSQQTTPAITIQRSNGVVYIYDTNGNQINAIVNITNPSTDIRFGTSVAIGSNIIAVGAPAEPKDLQAPLNNRNYGAVYIYDLNGNFIRKLQPVTPPLVVVGNFGISVAIADGMLVVGQNSSSVNRIYTYDINSNYTENVITTTNDSPNGSFRSVTGPVAIGNGKIVVGNTGTFFPSPTGVVDIFNTNGTGKISLSRSGNQGFGYSVAVGDNVIVIGAPFNDSQSTNNGSVYIFNLSGALIRQIFPSNTTSFEGFGNSVAVSDGRIVVGTFKRRLYQFKTNGCPLGSILDPSPSSTENFSDSVAAGEGKIVAGSPDEWNAGTSTTYNSEPPGSVYILSCP